jgi:formylglycine-generating enzyme required for sulfatase activity
VQEDDHPVVDVSWNDATAFCEWLSSKEGMSYRLPTEAQWEYACRAGTTTRYFTGDAPSSLRSVGNVGDRSLESPVPLPSAVTWDDAYPFTAPIGRFQPNPFGLYDMLGNVQEWCADWYSADYYTPSSATDPTGPPSGSLRVLRGGCWSYRYPQHFRSAVRNRAPPDSTEAIVGFRVVCEIERKRGEGRSGAGSGRLSFPRSSADQVNSKVPERGFGATATTSIARFDPEEVELLQTLEHSEGVLPVVFSQTDL